MNRLPHEPPATHPADPARLPRPSSPAPARPSPGMSHKSVCTEEAGTVANPRPAPVVLTDGERARLAAWAGDPAAGPLAVRARIVLACADGAPGGPAGRPVSTVAAELGLSRDTVRKWRSRFLAMRLAGLGDAPRPGAPRTITDEQVAGVIARLLLEPPPAGRRRWSTRLMAAETGMSQSAVSRIWRQAGLSDPGR